MVQLILGRDVMTETMPVVMDALPHARVKVWRPLFLMSATNMAMLCTYLSFTYHQACAVMQPGVLEKSVTMATLLVVTAAHPRA